MESNGSEQHKYYDQNKGILGDYAGREHFPVSGGERRQWRTKRKFHGEGGVHVPSSSTQDWQFRFGNHRPYDGNMVPHGWLDCPAYGQAIDYIIPSKVPLGESFNEHVSSKRYTPEHVIHQQRLLGREFGMVIDLTNTNRYYPLSAWSKEGIRHVKIRCKGRDSVPDDASVDKFVHEVSKFCSQGTQPEKFILVHCTHGHNRTGYMIAHFLIRTKSISVTEAIDIFSKARPPGIYKDDYIDSLYLFYHEKRPEVVICPQTPEWKRSPDPDSSGEAVQDAKNESTLLHNYVGDHVMTNDDLLGDTVSSDQLRAMRQTCYQLLKVARGNQQFPGSHPVSLNRINMQLLRQRYYYATWKADGTRYMMLITWDGCYLIDRNFVFRRIDMRFPCKQTDKGIPDQTHHYTLLDGEMVIDMDSNTQKQERRYLIYDVMAINHASVGELPFHERWKLLEKEVIEPRNMEREALSKSTNPFYRYDLEPFSVRRKDFWLLSTVDKLLKKFIPKLPHEADGLIFQGWDDPYVPRTHEGLLKWKYLHMNSVDFLFEMGDDNRPILFLFDRGRKKLMEGNRVVFNDASDPSSYSGKIIECSWDSERHMWVFMRVRTDKSTPNDFNTFKKVSIALLLTVFAHLDKILECFKTIKLLSAYNQVMRSIRDNITEEVLFKEINEIIYLPMYADRIQRDIRAHQNTMSSRRR